MERKYDKLFVGGDLSGIQKFLYNITSRKAAVSLKGRSGFLTQYLFQVCNKIEQSIEAAGDSNYVELYCSGGKFYLITKNLPSVIEAIDSCTKEITERLWEEHKGQLGINISHIAFDEENNHFYVEGHTDEEQTNSGILWKYLNADFARQKNQQFKELLVEKYDEFFEVQQVGGKPKVCAVTGIESNDCRPLDDANNIDEDVENSEHLVFLPVVIEQINLGIQLSKEQHLLNKLHKVKSFSDYADGSYLGILRMDVDGLGKRFIIGFDTIEIYKQFSKKVKNFFENYIGGGNKDYKGERLLDEKDPETGMPYREFLNIIYAGGDDLFIVGRWDKLIEFAEKIHTKTVEHFKDDWYEEDITDRDGRSVRVKHFISISGGITIVKPKFPIAKAAELAGQAEEAAKQGEKNAFNMFGKTISWDKEFEKVKQYKNDFVQLIKDNLVSKSILHKLMLYSYIADTNKVCPPEKRTYSYVWHLSYFLARYQKRYEGNKKVYDLCRRLNTLAANDRELELVAVAARWTELLSRDKTTNND